MSRQLILLRHAKSSWDSGAKHDFDRPLNKRGQRNALRMGRWLKDKRLVPDYIVSSPAIRAEMTIHAVVKELGLSKGLVVYDESLYLGDRTTLLQVLSRYPETSHRGLLVGHNPGLEDLLLFLCGDVARLVRDRKIMVTAAIAHLTMPKDWDDLRRGTCELVNLVRPKELE